MSDILEANDRIAAASREVFDKHSNLVINLMSSAGAGKTTLLERTEEALHILDISEEAGLIHCSSNTGKHIYYMCNCCECHCGVIQSIKNSAVPSLGVSSSFIVNVDEEECTGCGDCIDRCQMDALTMKGDIVVRDSERCIGCGLCISVCPTEALKLELREDAPVPFADRRELNAAMMPSSK